MPNCVAPPLSLFIKKLAPYYPISYRKAYKWASNDLIPTWPRDGQEQYRIRVGDELKKFLLMKGVCQRDVEGFINSLLYP